MIYIVEELKDGKHWNEKVFTRKREAFNSVKEQIRTRNESKFIMRTFNDDGDIVEVRYF